MNEQFIADLEKYIEKLVNLRVWKQGDTKAPHKLFLLLSIFSILDKNVNHENKFTFKELETQFNQIVKYYFPKIPVGQIFLESPFYHLTSEGFWHHKIKTGAESTYNKYKVSKSPNYRFTKKRISETIDYGYLSEDLYKLLKNRTNKKKLTDIITMRLNSEVLKKESTSDVTTSLFQHEALAIDAIRNLIERYQIGRMISNYNVFDSQTNDYYECDVLLIASSGIYIIELKHWSGHIRVAPYNWVKDNSIYRADPHRNNSFKAKIIKGIYQHRFRTYPNVWAESVVVMTNTDAIIEGSSSPKTDKHCPTFESIDSLIDYLRHRKKTIDSVLSFQQIQSVENYFRSLEQPKKESAYAVPGYEIVEQLTTQTDRIEIIARPTDGRHRNLNRFRIFMGSPNIESREKEQYAQRARNTLDAVSKIGDHNNILKVWRVPDERGMVIEGSDWSEEGTLRDLINRRDAPFSMETSVGILRGILAALRVSHEENVIHRAVKPENILMVNGTPKLMNYDVSYRLEEDRHVTVISDPESMPRDAYTAPEIFSGGDIDESSDLFSAGVILYEMLSGALPFDVSTDLNALGGRIGDAQISHLKKHDVPDRIISLIESLLLSDRRERIRSAEEVLQVLDEDPLLLKTPIVEDVPNKVLDKGMTYDVYTIEALLAKGRDSQVYLAKTVGAIPVALKMFNRDVPIGRIQNEEQIASATSSSYLVRTKRLGYWNNNRYFLEMNFIEGQSMREEVEQGTRPDMNKFSNTTLCLLQGIASLHHNQTNGEKTPILHGDIKPDNIIVTKDGKAVLIDFGISGPPRTDFYQGTDGYVAPDLMKGSDLQFCENGDLFALGVTLFEWFLGRRPFEGSPTCGSVPCDPQKIDPNISEALRQWFQRAVQTETINRFQDVETMRQSFELSIREEAPKKEEELPIKKEPVIACTPVREERGNPFVAYLNSLHNVTANNENALAESQAINPFFSHIHVSLRVTDYIESILNEPNGPDVILTGHAGDGKSTIGLELYKRLKGLPDKQPLDHTMESIEHVRSNGISISIVKDMSELEETQRLSFFAEKASDSQKRYFLISNTGTLLNIVERLCDDRATWLTAQNELLEALEGIGPQDINIGKRLCKIINLSLIDNITTACQVFERMLDPKLWDVCKSNECRDQCPIYTNVKILQTYWDTTSKRIEWIYRRLYEYGYRLTLRQMSAHLAYAITAGLDYERIHDLSQRAVKPPLRNYLFFNLFFGDSDVSKPEVEQLKAIQNLQVMEAGTRTHPDLERQLWMKEDSASFKINNKELYDIFKHLRHAGRGGVEALKSSVARIQMRRLLYCYGTFESQAIENKYVSIFLNSPMITDFVMWQKSGGKLSPVEKSTLKRRILHVLQEHFSGIRLPENTSEFDTIYVTLNRRSFDVRQSAQIVLKKFLADDFDLVLSSHDSGISETRYQLQLIASKYVQNLPLELPFLDYVTLRHQGEIAQQMQAFYSDRLERFKVGLLGKHSASDESNMMIVRLQLNHRFKSHTFSIHNHTLEVTQ